ncbi:ATP-binding cassette domain-containing protein [Apilactobacillus ozensis]|uniref:ATP-binding cassette domain-containing protein n=1 Tax=Apilactobacillus ozensis TaxID=866801 RepID=UPI00200A07F3|nr:ATP-binding cassette domain-containing protein [Apilactobacillus ozensis]MCK8607159.1 ATP-binding cassette domain-containing protein [Apilactobacillus ozensis]
MTLNIKKLSISYGNMPVINNFNYIFNDSGLYMFFAPNGSGKTSIFRAIMGLIASKNMGITIDGKNVQQNKDKIFYYESSNWMDNNMSGLDYLKFIKSQWRSKVSVKATIDFFNMNNYIKKPIKKYSLGMKQKLLFSLYLISDAKYLIMDEINNGLDAESRKRLFLKIKKLSQEKCIIISSHYKDELLPYVDKKLTIHNCEVIC